VSEWGWAPAFSCAGTLGCVQPHARAAAAATAALQCVHPCVWCIKGTNRATRAWRGTLQPYQLRTHLRVGWGGLGWSGVCR
jgi:hypothetical protein